MELEYNMYFKQQAIKEITGKEYVILKMNI